MLICASTLPLSLSLLTPRRSGNANNTQAAWPGHYKEPNPILQVVNFGNRQSRSGQQAKLIIHLAPRRVYSIKSAPLVGRRQHTTHNTQQHTLSAQFGRRISPGGFRTHRRPAQTGQCTRRHAFNPLNERFKFYDGNRVRERARTHTFLPCLSGRTHAVCRVHDKYTGRERAGALYVSPTAAIREQFGLSCCKHTTFTGYICT